MQQKIQQIIGRIHKYEPYYDPATNEATLICRICGKWFNHSIHDVKKRVGG